RPGISCNVVSAGQNHNNLGMQIDHILPEPHQHLGSGLPADTAVDVGLAGEIILQLPDVGDRITEEYDSILACGRGAELRVGLAITRQLSVVVGEYGDTRRAVLIEPREAGAGNGRRLRRLLRES